MIHGYPARVTLCAGERLRLHVSTSAPAFRVEFHRQGASLVRQGASDSRRGRLLPPGRHDAPWNWPGEDFDIPHDWPPGVYLALLVEVGDGGSDLTRPEPVFDGRDARALFVVRPSGGGPSGVVLYKLALATYHAYNASGGGSLYHAGGWLPSDSPARVTTLRPGGGTGGDLSFPGAPDPYDRTSPREGFAHWDAPMIEWLERAGHRVDFCTDLDIDRDPAILAPYRLLLSVGHDEYWSAGVRHAVQRFAECGGNVAFFGGNTCWWRVNFDEDGAIISCLHPPVSSARSDQWWRIHPENALTGVSYRNAGGWWSGEREPLGYTVQHAGHWIYEGTGVQEGGSFGAEDHLVGYECDGARLTRSADGLLLADTGDGTPADFVVLGHAQLGMGWQDRPLGAEATATLGLHQPGGTVFTCATTDWSRVLRAGHPVVERITANVVQRLADARLHIAGSTDGGADAFAGGGGHTAVAGARTSFHVMGDLSGDDAEHHWTLAAGGTAARALEGRGPSITVIMPGEPGLATITVTRTGKAGRAFGTRTIRVLSRREAAQVALLSDLRDLVLAAVPSLSSTRGVGAGNRPFGDQDWDAVRDGLRAMIDPGSIAQLLARVQRLAGSLARLSEP